MRRAGGVVGSGAFLIGIAPHGNPNSERQHIATLHHFHRTELADRIVDE